jgi:threonyl-tRNA synthetase
VKQLRENGIRAHADISAQRMNAKIRQAQLMKVPYMLVVGDQEMAANSVSLRKRDGARQDGMPVEEFIKLVLERIASRSDQL